MMREQKVLCVEVKEDLEQNRSWGGGEEDHKLGGRASASVGLRAGKILLSSHMEGGQRIM